MGGQKPNILQFALFSQIKMLNFSKTVSTIKRGIFLSEPEFLSKPEFAELLNYRISCAMLTKPEFERIFTIGTLRGLERGKPYPQSLLSPQIAPASPTFVYA
jgi:hypothetical protein